MRVFVAIDLSEPVKDTLGAVQARLTVGRPSPPENLHVTLAFLDDQPLPVVEAAHEALEEIELPEFDIALSGLELLGGRRPRLLYARVAPAAPLSALRDKVHSALRRAEIVLPREQFRPHVTLTRFRRDMPPADMVRIGQFLEREGDFRLAPVAVTAFELCRSTLHAEGAVHDTLAQYPLKRREGVEKPTPFKGLR